MAEGRVARPTFRVATGTARRTAAARGPGPDASVVLMDAHNSYATTLTGCTYATSGPCLVLKFQHPAALRGMKFDGLLFGHADASRRHLRACYLAIKGASRLGRNLEDVAEPVVVYLDERHTLVGLLFINTMYEVDFRTFLAV